MKKSTNTPYTLGYYAIDKIIGALKPGIISITGKSSTGKSLIALDIALNITRQKGKVLHVSFEQPYEVILQKIATSTTLIPYSRFMRIPRHDNDQEATEFYTGFIPEKYRSLAHLNKPLTLKELTKYLVKGANEVVVIDYVELIERGDMTIDDVVISLDAVAKELGITLVIVGQYDLSKTSYAVIQTNEKKEHSIIGQVTSGEKKLDICFGVEFECLRIEGCIPCF